MTTTTHEADEGGLLAEEILFYEANKDEFIRDHLNRYLLIKGQVLIASYETEGAAIGEGVRRFGTEPFLVRLSGEDTPVSRCQP